MTTLQIGKTNYSRTNTEKLTYYKLGMKDNQRNLTVRIAPPIKSLADSGMYAVYVKQHFGYQMQTTPRDGKEAKSFPVPFSCIERRDRNKNVVQECPECNEIALRKASLDSKRARLKADGVSEDAVEAQVRPMAEWLKSHNLDKKWNLLAKDESGKWGYLTLSHTAFTDLQREIADLIANGIEDPLGVEGVWFKFTRAGDSFNNIKDTCKAVVVKAGAGFQYKTDSLTQTDFDALDALPELVTLGRKISYEQIQSLVESGGDPEVCKAVFNSSQRTETSPRPVAEVNVKAQPQTPPVVQEPSAATVKAPTPAEQPSATALQAQLAALQAQLASLQQPAATPKPEVKATQPAPTSTMVKQLEMDPDEFLAQFGAD